MSPALSPGLLFLLGKLLSLPLAILTPHFHSDVTTTSKGSLPNVLFPNFSHGPIAHITVYNCVVADHVTRACFPSNITPLERCFLAYHFLLDIYYRVWKCMYAEWVSSFPVWKSHEKTRDKGGFYWLLHHLQWLFPLPSMTWEWAVDMQLLSCGPAYKASQYHSLSEINQMACLTYTDVIFRTFPEPRLLHFQDIFFNYKKTITNGHPEFFSWNIFLLNAGADRVCAVISFGTNGTFSNFRNCLKDHKSIRLGSCGDYHRTAVFYSTFLPRIELLKMTTAIYSSVCSLSHGGIVFHSSSIWEVILAHFRAAGTNSFSW